MLSILTIVSLAHAGNLDPSSMGDWNGTEYTKQSAIQTGFGVVSKQLGLAIANKPQGITSMGLHGFEMSLHNTIAMIDSKAYPDGSPSPWNLAFTTEEAPPALWLPTINVSKGFPLSIEVGLRTGIVYKDTGSLFGSYIRCSPIEGYNKAPDLTFQVGYAGYIGNSDMAVGTMDASATLGKAIPFGPMQGVHSAVIRPYVASAMYWVRSDPRLTEKETDQLGLTPVSAFKKSDYYTDGYRLFSIDGGVEIENNEFIFGFAASYAPGNLLSFQQNFGFSF